MSYTNKSRIYLSLIFASFFCTAYCAAETPDLPGSDVVGQSAATKLQNNAEKFANFSYPSVTHRSATLGTAIVYRDGSFSIPVKFLGYWEPNEQSGSFTLRFQFTSSGKLIRVVDGSRSWFFPPFTESELMGGILKQIFEEMAKDDPKLQNDFLFRKAMNSSVREAVVFLFNVT